MLDPGGEVKRRYDLYLMKQEGLNKLIESAIKLINKGFDIDDVIEATGLSKELLLKKIK